MIKHVFIVNGGPRVGKDTVVDFMRKALEAAQIRTDAFSSIDPVRAMLTGAGFDLEHKTGRDRALLAIVGAAVETHSFWRSRWSARATKELFDKPGSAVMFIHAREPEIIERIVRMIACDHGTAVRVTKLLVRSPRGETELTNDADRNVEKVAYDIVLTNDGTLEDLERKCETVLFNLDLIGQFSLLS